MATIALADGSAQSHSHPVAAPPQNSLAFLPAAFVVGSNPNPSTDLSTENIWITQGQKILHHIAGDDTAAFFGVNPSLRLIRSPAVHASVSHNGTVFVSSGMLKLIETESEYAFIIAHEMAHILLGHHHTFATSPRDAIATELQADSLAIELLRESGFEESSGAALLTRISGFGPRSGLTIARLFPSLRPRLRALKGADTH